MRVVLVVIGFVVGGALGLILGMVAADVVVSAAGSLDESEYIGIQALVPLGAATVAAVAGGVAGARWAPR